MSVRHLRRHLVLFGACVAALCICMTTGCKEPVEAPPAVRPVKSLVLESASSAVSRKYPGSVQASQRAELAFKVSGPLIELPVQEGQEVEEGDLLAKIDPRDFNTRLADAQSALAEAEANLRSMRTARPEDIQRLKARLEADKAKLTEAAGDLARNQKLFEQRIIPKGELDKAVAANDVAVANVNASQQNLERGMAGARTEDIESTEAQIQGLQAQVDTAQHALDDTALEAPFKGVVARRLVENSENVAAKQPIIWFQDLEHVEIIINLPENVIATASQGMAAELKAVFDALPGKEYAVTVKEFSTEADPGTQTYKTTLTMPQPEEINVLSGMTCTVVHYEKAVGGADGSEFLIPVTAVCDEEGKQCAWVIDPETNTVSQREVQVADLTGDSIRVVGGLNRGETIAISGVHFLKKGMEVRLLGPEIGDQLK